jgi:hypothetical protein
MSDLEKLAEAIDRLSRGLIVNATSGGVSIRIHDENQSGTAIPNVTTTDTLKALVASWRRRGEALEAIVKINDHKFIDVEIRTRNLAQAALKEDK